MPLLLPTSGGKDFLGRSGVAVSPRIIGEWVSEGGTRVLANVGINLQPSEQLYNLNVGNEFAYGLGTEVPVITLAPELEQILMNSLSGGGRVGSAGRRRPRSPAGSR